MSKMVGIIGTSRGLDFSLSENLVTLNKHVGHNTGNLVFQYATAKILGGDVFDVGINATWDPNLIREKCDKVVFPCANFINPDSDFEGLANYLISLKLPIVAIGLGAQSKDYQSDRIPLKKGTEKLVRFLCDSANTVGVRGQYTSQVLDGMGIHNHVVLGCPSNLITPCDDLEESFKRKLSNPVKAITVNGHNPWSTDVNVKEIEKFLFKIAIENDGDYLAQSHDPLLRLASGCRYCEKAQWDVDVDGLYRASEFEGDFKLFERFVRKNFYFETHVPSWLRKSSYYDFSLGLRLHGNMAAFQSGTPSLWITHDSRTSELVEFMKLPQVSFNTLKKISGLDDLKEIFLGQLNDYIQKRKQLDQSVNCFLKNNSLLAS